MNVSGLGFLAPLFELAESLLDTNDPTTEDPAGFGLGHIGEQSPLWRDDQDMDGLWVSSAVNQGIMSALDHVLMFRELIAPQTGSAAGQRIPNLTANAPWTLLRGTLEPSSTALWILTGEDRQVRRLRALRTFFDDYCQQKKWEDDTDVTATGLRRMAWVLRVGNAQGLAEAKIKAPLVYSDCVAHAGAAVGRTRKEARARWREASGFAHGRFWATVRLSELKAHERIPGGLTTRSTIDSQRLEELAALVLDVLNACIDSWAELSDNVPD